MKSFRCLCVLLFVCASSAAYAQFAAEMGQHSDVQAAEQQISNLKSTYSFFKKYELITQQKNQPERRAEYSGIRRANAKQSCGIFFMQKNGEKQRELLCGRNALARKAARANRATIRGAALAYRSAGNRPTGGHSSYTSPAKHSRRRGSGDR